MNARGTDAAQTVIAAGTSPGSNASKFATDLTGAEALAGRASHAWRARSDRLRPSDAHGRQDPYDCQDGMRHTLDAARIGT